MNLKENILFLRNEGTTTGDADKTDRIDLGKCIHLYDETQGNTSTFNRKLSLSGARKQIIIKEEGSKKDSRQEEADVKTNIKKMLRMYICRIKTTDSSKQQKLGGFLSGQIVANTEHQNKQDLPTVCWSLLLYNSGYGFVAN